MGDATKKQVKVDNWGMFFLQRIQQHFSKGEFCDVRLQFSNNEIVMAHRLVLDVCTEYFQMLEKQGNVVDDCINMPADMEADVVVPVINFMYTGRLEFRADIQSRLYLTAQKMKMTVLTKLLDAQSLNTKQQQLLQQTRPKSATIIRAPQKKVFPPGTFTNLQGKKISPRLVDPNLPQTLPGRKLPIWTRRNMPAYSGISMSDYDRPIKILGPTVDETPRPTRFEWPDDDDDNAVSPLRTTFEDISYESKPLMQLKEPHKIVPVVTPRAQQTVPQRTATFEEVMRTGAVTKRPATSPISNDSGKKSKVLDLQAVKEYVQETQVRKNMIKEDSDEDVDNDLEDLNNGDEDDDEDFLTPRHATPHKSILKTQSSHDEDVSTTSSKKVRFSLDPSSTEEKENAAKVTEQILPRALPHATPGPATSVTNHAKIITEVLKKYPHLVKNNKNIRLKIMQRGGTPSQIIEHNPSRSVKSKVSYVVLKSDVVDSKGNAAMGIKQGCLVEQQSPVKMQQKPLSGAENVSGPWLCHTCGSNEDPITFETYFDYRHHLQDVHMEKIDARICEHCGHRASKRNLLLYHQFTKHGVTPPRNCQFPKCDQCEYVALSESLLIKHRNNHSNTKDYVCKVCNTSFKSNGALQGHMQANLHSDPFKKLYECPYCNKQFARNINLKAHLRQFHKDESRRFEDDDLELECLGDDMLAEDSEGQVMEVPVINMINQTESGMTILAEAPVGMECSSEAEGLSHVASGIATSLGLTDGQQTVILLDENQEFIIHTTEEVANEYLNDGSIVQQVQEYIVPEMVGDEQSEGNEERTEGEDGAEHHVLHGQEEVMMVLTDHCYAEEVVTREEPLQVDENNFDSENLELSETKEDMNDEEAKVEQENDEKVEQALATFENDVAKNKKRIFSLKLSSHTNNSLPPTPSSIKTYSPTKKSALPVPPSINNEPVKPAIAMSDLLDDWDEELSQETDGQQESSIPKHPSALPTRADVSDDIYAMARVQGPLVEQMSQQSTEQQLMSESEDTFHDELMMDVPNDEEDFSSSQSQPLPPFTDIAQPLAKTEDAIMTNESDGSGMLLEEEQTSEVTDNTMVDDEPLLKQEDTDSMHLPMELGTTFPHDADQALLITNTPFETESEQISTFSQVANEPIPPVSEEGGVLHIIETEQDSPFDEAVKPSGESPDESDLHDQHNNGTSTMIESDSDQQIQFNEKSDENLTFVKEPLEGAPFVEDMEHDSSEANHILDK